MSHIPIDFGRPFDIELFSPPLTCFLVLNVGVFHIVGMSCPHQRSIPSWWKKVSLASLLPRNVSLLVSVYEKFVLAYLSRQISG